MVTVHEDECTFMITSRRLLFIVINFPDKSYWVNQNIHFVFSNIFLFKKSFFLWENVEKYCGAIHVTDDNMAHAHCLLDTRGYRHTLIFNAFPQQQWLRERAPMLRLHVHPPVLLIDSMVSNNRHIFRGMNLKGGALFGSSGWRWFVHRAMCDAKERFKTCTRGCW